MPKQLTEKDRDWIKTVPGTPSALTDPITPEEIAKHRNVANREALSDDEKWRQKQETDLDYHLRELRQLRARDLTQIPVNPTLAPSPLIAPIIAYVDEQYVFHSLAVARAYRNLGRFSEARTYAIQANDDDELARIATYKRGVVDDKCGCQPVPQVFSEEVKSKGKTLEHDVTIMPDTHHRAERVVLNGEVVWLDRCSQCKQMCLHVLTPQRAKIREMRASGKGMADKELLK